MSARRLVSTIALLVTTACGARPAPVAPSLSEAPRGDRPVGVLRVEIANVEAFEGSVVVAAYDSEERFLAPHAERARAVVRATSDPTVVELHDVPEGRVALAVFHDVDDDGVLDTSLVGYPTEPFGFSNDASLALFGPPKFAACAFDVRAPRTTVRIHLRE